MTTSIKAISFLSAFGWVASSILWMVAARIKAKSSLPPPAPHQMHGTTMTRLGHYINGVPQLTVDDIQEYIRKSGKWNSLAAAVSAISAAATALVLFLS